MADVKKFLDQAGVSTLWSRIADELKDKQTAIDAVNTKAETNAGKIKTLEGKVDTLEKNAYNDTEVRGLISTNSQNIAKNTAAITTLNGDVNTEGSVIAIANAQAKAEVAAIVGAAPETFDTLEEIANWIANDESGAAAMVASIAANKTAIEAINNETTGILPCFFDTGMGTSSNSLVYEAWKYTCEVAERKYFELLNYGAKPQEARSVLPNSLKTEIIVTANETEWQHIINLRYLGTTGAPHPQMKEVMSLVVGDLNVESEGRLKYETN